VACELVQALLHAHVPAAEIGIVTPYRAQARLIRNQLRRLKMDEVILKSILVDTVERMQGQEREVVLISLTTSNPSFAELLAEFYFQPERLNVAITRPRTKLIIIGSRYVLQVKPEDLQIQSWVEMLKDLLSSCFTVTVDNRRSHPWRA
jgi:DNA replication ATP-dependent helicase Dna2